MATQPTGLGRGLDALIRETQDTPDGSGVRMLPLSDIVPNPRQPRRSFSEKGLEELAASIRSQGLLQPLLVRPMGAPSPGKYEIVAGERRWRASQMAGLSEVPALIRSFTAQDTLAAALIENIQREDLNPVEEAQGLHILKEEFGLSQDDLAQKLGKSRSAVANSLRLLTLPESIRTLLAEGRLSAGHARALLSISEPKAQEQLKNLILDGKLSVREAEGLASGWKESGRFLLATGAMDGRSAPVSDPDTRGQSAPETDGEALRSGRKSRPQSAKILEIQNRIGELYELPVRVTGKENKGKISFSYSSKEELEALLERLAQFALEGGRRPALAGRESVALDATVMEQLGGLAMSVLDSVSRESLAANGRQALDASSQAALGHKNQAVLNQNRKQALAEPPARAALGAGKVEAANEAKPDQGDAIAGAPGAEQK